jgi:hypothetical protein
MNLHNLLGEIIYSPEGNWGIWMGQGGRDDFFCVDFPFPIALFQWYALLRTNAASCPAILGE